jgi:hypothetical protein|tara:strand:- start:72 stop:179 length:108 start_codon:yes stop_codon:yes gene_type:complete
MDLDGNQTPPLSKKGWIIAVATFIITMIVLKYLEL